MDEAKGVGCEGGSGHDLREQGLCIRCGLPALERCYSDAGRVEVLISGLCELCFDEAVDLCLSNVGEFTNNETKNDRLKQVS